MDPFTGVVLQPGAGHAEGLVEDRIEFLGIVGGGDAVAVGLAVAVEIAVLDRLEESDVVVGGLRRRYARLFKPIRADDRLRHAWRIDVEQIGIVLETLDIVRKERVLQIGRLRQPVVPVLEHALLGHLGIAALK